MQVQRAAKFTACRESPGHMQKNRHHLPSTCRKAGRMFVVLMPSIAISEYLEFSKSQLLLEPTAALSAVSIASNTTDALAHPVQFSQHSAPVPARLSSSHTVRESRSAPLPASGQLPAQIHCANQECTASGLPNAWTGDGLRCQPASSQSNRPPQRTSAPCLQLLQVCHICQGCAASLSASGRSEHQSVYSDQPTALQRKKRPGQFVALASPPTGDRSDDDCSSCCPD